MERRSQTHIDEELCIGCGDCVRVCPSDTLAMEGGKAKVVFDRSLQCGHCAAVCPTDAITVSTIDPDAWKLATISFDPARAKESLPKPEEFASLLAIRRSCRNFSDKPVPREVLEDLVRMGTMAPSGTNSQSWTFNIAPDRKSVERIAVEMGHFFDKLNRLTGMAPVRFAARLIPGDPIGMYYREYRERAMEALEEYRRGGRDRLFHGAPALILIGSKPGGSLPLEDANLASQNILLAAETMGLATCLIGFAVESLRFEPKIKGKIGLPAKEMIHSVIAVGYPSIRYRRPAGRLRVPIHWLRLL